jgi:uncharacterized protein (DUF952 family)
VIFKIVQSTDWLVAEREGRFEGSAHDKLDGFMHFSTARQLAETLSRHYAGMDDLLLLAVDETKLGSDVRWENSASRGERFPHLYRALDVSAVQWKHPLARDAEGRHIIPAMARVLRAP